MRVYRMNQKDIVVHKTFEDASLYYNKIFGLFRELKDDFTGEEYDIDRYTVRVSGKEGEMKVLTVKEGIKQGLIEIPFLYECQNH